MKKHFLLLGFLAVLAGCRSKVNEVVVVPEKVHVESVEPAMYEEVVVHEADDVLEDDAPAVNLKHVYFDFDESNIRDDQMPVLAGNVAAAREAAAAGHGIVVEGHADHFAGSHEYNYALSQRRAETVASYLAKQGVNKARLQIVPRGDTMPLVKGGNKVEQEPNRRVELHIK